MKKTAYIGIIVVILIMVIVAIGFLFRKNETVDGYLNQETQTKETTTVLNEQTNEVVNEIIRNEIVNETIRNEAVNETKQIVSSETLQEKPKTAEEKVIEIVKKDWGNDSDVTFVVDLMDENGNYRVSVRDSQTKALAYYTVNLATQTFTKREMN